MDDSRLQHTIVGQYLRGTEFVVRGHAFDGDEALRLCRETAPDLILLDLVLPGIGGREMLERLLVWNPGARVVVASALVAHDLIRELLRAGAREFLPKPFSRDDLIDCLRRAAAAGSRWMVDGRVRQEAATRSLSV